MVDRCLRWRTMDKGLLYGMRKMIGHHPTHIGSMRLYVVKNAPKIQIRELSMHNRYLKKTYFQLATAKFVMSVLDNTKLHPFSFWKSWSSTLKRCNSIWNSWNSIWNNYKSIWRRYTSIWKHHNSKWKMQFSLKSFSLWHGYMHVLAILGKYC